MPALSAAVDGPDRGAGGARSQVVGVLAGAVPGALLGAAAGVAARIRRTKPLHPRGVVGSGRFSVTVPRPELGIPLLAEVGEHGCLVRWSRATGFPPPLPDVEGLAVRFGDPTADLLFASTGAGAVTRHLLLPRRPGRHGPQTTLLPVATAAGPLIFEVEPVPGSAEPPETWTMSVARPGRPWAEVGSLRVVWGEDEAVRFDPVGNLLPGTRQYPLVRAMREPAYLLARVAAEPHVLSRGHRAGGG